MSFKSLIRNSKKLSDLTWAIRGLWGDNPQKTTERHFKPKTRHLIDEYLVKNGLKKLHIGAQTNVLENWLNVDFYTSSNDQMAYLDATKPFPLPDESFDYVFSEHMIEHIEFHEASKMLKECYRILRRGGKIRIATPDSNRLRNLNLNSGKGKEYFDELVRSRIEKELDFRIGYFNDYVINYMMYNFNHKFLYSFDLLSDLLRSSGFNQITQYDVHKSNDINFIDVEHHGKKSNILCDLETMNIEATK